MILADWLESNGLKAYKFAKAVGISPPTIYRSIHGIQRLSARYAVVVEEYTKGAVSRTEAVWPEDFVDVDPNGNVQMRMTAKIKERKDA